MQRTVIGVLYIAINIIESQNFIKDPRSSLASSKIERFLLLLYFELKIKTNPRPNLPNMISKVEVDRRRRMKQINETLNKILKKEHLA